MKLDIMAFGLTVAMVWAAGVLAVALIHLFVPSYGGAFLDVVASLYPGYKPGGGVASVVAAALYAIVDGGLGGALFAWLYNRTTAGGRAARN